MKELIKRAILWVPILMIAIFPTSQSFSGLDNKDMANLARKNASEGLLGLRLFEFKGGELSILERILRGANIKLQVFESDEKEESASLGFEYAYSKDFAIHSFDSEQEGKQLKTRNSALIMNFDAEGTVAFDKDRNPNNFLDTNLSFLWYRSKGGVLPKDAKPGTDLFKFLNHLEDVSVEAETIEGLDDMAEWQELKETVLDQLSDQYYFDLSGKGGLESDQSFSTKQYYYGLNFGFIVRGWNPEKSAWAKFNIFDYPTALLRLLSGADKGWRPRGSCFPELLVGLDHVDPDTGTPREELAGDSSSFARARFEASFRTLALTYKDANAFLEANFRHYNEIDASDQVKEADLDAYTYFTIALVMPAANGMYVSYTTGALPLDAKSDQVYAVGIKYKF